MTGTTGNATAKVEGQLTYYENDQLISERYRLDIWPLFALGDGGGVPIIRSDSLVRVQVYTALAYGARGLYYYCWVRCSLPLPPFSLISAARSPLRRGRWEQGHGIWNMPKNPQNNQVCIDTT